MFYYVYVLKSDKDESLYIGYTKDLRKRFQEHNRKLNFSTKAKTPWQIIHYEAYLSEDDAIRREKYLKTGHGSNVLKRMLKDYLHYYKLNKSKN